MKLICHKINEDMKRKPGVKCFLQLHNFVKTDQNTTKLYSRFFFHKIDKNMS